MIIKFFSVVCLALLILTGFGAGAAAGPQAEIVRDEYGVPHIYAETLEGLFFGYGYAAAEDRLYQMEMFRRTFWGELSVVYGEKLLPFDQTNRRDNLTFNEIKKQIDSLDSEYRIVLNSFAEGINAYITEALADRENKLPKEFHHFGFDPEPWSAEDVAADFLSVMGFFMDVSGELANASMLNFLNQKHDADIAQKMFDDWCWGLDPESATTMDVPVTTAVHNQNAHFSRYGDNSLTNGVLAAAGGAQKAWVLERLARNLLMREAYPFCLPTSYALLVSPEKSASGKAMLMGGPQFNFQVPSALYEVGLHGAGIDAVGSTLTGYPFLMFSYNRRAAFSSTAGMDNIEDIFAEKLNPRNSRQYWYKGAWRDMEVRIESFRVKDTEEPVMKELSYTVHGPVFYVDEQNNVAFSKRLSCKESFLMGFVSFYEGMQAETVAEFNNAARLSDMSINYFFANVDGDIAYYHLGRHPVRAEGVDPRLPTPGTGEFEWRGYVPKTQNPHIANPANGFIANWNNQPAPGWGHGDMATCDVFGGWGYDSRVSCIKRAVQAKPVLSRDDVKGIIRDIAFYDKRALNIKGLLIEAVEEVSGKSPDAEEALRLLGEWNNIGMDDDGDGYYDHPGSALFDMWWNKALAATFGDEFEGYANVFKQTAVQILGNRYLGYTLFAKALRGKTKIDYFDGKKAEIVYQALEQALEELSSENDGKGIAEYRLKTRMDQFYPITVLGYFLHQPITTTLDELAPFPAVDRGTENHIVTLAPWKIKAENITAPGASGFVKADGVKSKHFDDQVQMFVDFTYKPMRLDDTDVRSAAQSSKVVEWK